MRREGAASRSASSGVLEALVECGPTLLDAFLAADLWDERVTIRQGPRPGEPDTVEILNRMAA